MDLKKLFGKFIKSPLGTSSLESLIWQCCGHEACKFNNKTSTRIFSYCKVTFGLSQNKGIKKYFATDDRENFSAEINTGFQVSLENSLEEHVNATLQYNVLNLVSFIIIFIFFLSFPLSLAFLVIWFSLTQLVFEKQKMLFETLFLPLFFLAFF